MMTSTKQALQALFITIHIHPIYIPLIAYIFGICLPNNSLLIFAGILILGLTCALVNNSPKKACILLASAFYLFGALAVKYNSYKFENFYTKFGTNTSCDGTVINIEKHHHLIFKYKVFIKGILYNDQNKENGTICIYTQKFPQHLQVGDTMAIEKLKIKKSKNSSFNRYLLKENINATTYANEIHAQVTHRPQYSWSRFIWNLKNNNIMRLKKVMSRKCFMMYSSLFLGNRSIVKAELEKHTMDFKAWGIIHYVARSGLHMVIFSMVLFILLSSLPFALWIRYVLIILLSCSYALLSWLSISFIRAFIMFLFYTISLLLKKYNNALHILVITCFATLLYNPFYIFFLDFQLSFFCTFILALLNQISLKQKQLPHLRI